MNPRDLIHPFSNLTVIGYKAVEKNKSNNEILSFSSAFAGTFALSLKVIITVNRVSTKPAKVSDTVDKSVASATNVSILGNENFSRV